MTFRYPALTASALAMIVAAGCQTASLEDAAPAAAVSPSSASGSQAAGTATDERGRSLGADLNIFSPVPLPENVEALPPKPDFVAEGVINTGEFPNVGAPRQAANSQITRDEQAAMEAEMNRLRVAQKADPSGAAQYRKRLAELRKLADTHASEAEKEIVK